MQPATAASRLPPWGGEHPGRRAPGAWHPSARTAAVVALVAGALPVAGVAIFPSTLYAVLPTQSFLVFHNVAEIFGIMVSFSIFGVGWFTHGDSKDRHTLFLAAAFLAVGLVDLMHTLSFPEMPAFFGPSTANRSAQYWLAARLITALAFLASAFVLPQAPSRWITRRALALPALAFPALVFVAVSFYPEHLPAAFDARGELTAFKIGCEYAIAALLLLAAVAYARRSSRTGEAFGEQYVMALVLCGYSELILTLNRSPFDTFAVLGHLYKIAAFVLVYRAAVIRAVRFPYAGYLAERRALEAEIQERRATEAALRASEESLRAAQRIAQLGLWDLDLATGTLRASEELSRLLDADARRPIGSRRAFLDAIHPEDRARVDEAFSRAVADRTPFDVVHRLLAGDGRVKEVRQRCEITYDAAGTPLRSIGVVQDVTDRAEAERRARTAALYARSLIEASLDPLVTISPEGKVTDVNRATEEVTGHPRERLVGTDFADYFTEPDLARAGYRRVLDQGTVRDYPLTIRHASGRTTDVLYNATVYRDEAGRRQGVFAAARDITDRKRAEASRAHLASIIEYSSDAIIGKSVEGVIRSWNLGAERIYGYSAAEMIGRRVDVLAPPGLEPESAALVDRIQRGEEVVNHETVRRRKDGQLIEVSLTLSPIRDAGGNIVGVSTIGRDVTERRRVEQQRARLAAELEVRVAERTEQLAAANRELEAFAYSVSHDLRAPLRHIGGFVELLRQRAQASLDDEARHYAAVISQSASAMGKMIDDLLAFSRMGRTELAKTRVAVGDLARDVIRELEPETRGRDVEWKVGDIPPVTADRELLRLALANLLANAAKFTRTRARAEIEIGCADAGGRAETVVFVRDNGVGFDMTYADKLFKVFQRLHRAEEFEGTGIGLANVRRIVERHGGRVWAEGAPGRGATFFFAVPNPATGAKP